eukprot:187912-Chlamydomonas_euryale.AAC.3
MQQLRPMHNTSHPLATTANCVQHQSLMCNRRHSCAAPATHVQHQPTVFNTIHSCATGASRFAQHQSPPSRRNTSRPR